MGTIKNGVKTTLDRIEEGGPDRWGLFNRALSEMGKAGRRSVGNWRNAAADGIGLRSQAHGVAHYTQDEQDKSLAVAVESAADLMEKAMADPRELLIKIRAALFLIEEDKPREARRAILDAMWYLDSLSIVPGVRHSYDYPDNYYADE